MSDRNINTATILLNTETAPRELINGTCHSFYWHNYDDQHNTMVLDWRPDETSRVAIVSITDLEAMEEIIERIEEGWALVSSKKDNE